MDRALADALGGRGGVRRVLLLGVTGQLGSYLAWRLGRDRQVISPAPRRPFVIPEALARVHWLDVALDARWPATLEPILEASRPDVVLNAVALTPKTRGATPEEMEDVNAAFPVALAERCRERGIRLVHFSTDGVFRGDRGPYRETDPPDADDPYGRTKAAGERLPAGVVVRTSFFGLSPLADRGFVRELLWGDEGPVRGYAAYRFNGLALPVLTRVVERLVDEFPGEGILHAGGVPLTKYELAEATVREFQLDRRVEPVPEPRCDRVLESARLWTWLGEEPPPLGRQMALIVEDAAELMEAE